MKKHFTILFFLSFQCFFSQKWKWCNSAPYPSYITVLNNVTKDNFGNSFISGSTLKGVFIVKYDPSGNKIWEKYYPDGYGSVTSLCTDSEGNLYTCFWAKTVEGVTYNKNNGAGLFAKYDVDGAVVWIKQIKYGLILSEHSDSDNNLIATGSVIDTISLGNGITLIQTSPYANKFLAKFNASGSCLWAVIDEGGQYSLNMNVRNEIITKGIIYEPTTFGKGNQQITLDPSDGGAYCAKYDSTGGLTWVQQLHTADIALDDFGNTYTFEPDVSDLAHHSNKNIYLVKRNNSGEILWKKTHIYLDKPYRFAMRCNYAGDLFITGGFTNYMTVDDTTIYDGGNTRTFVARIDSSGKLRWITTSGGPGGCGGKDITVRGKEIFIVGDIGGGVNTFGPWITSQNNGVFVAKLIDNDTLTMNHNLQPNENSFLIYPNPSSSTISISGKIKGCSIQVCDVNGKVICAAKNIQENKIEIDLSRNERGIYFVSVINAETVETKKIVLE